MCEYAVAVYAFCFRSSYSHAIHFAPLFCVRSCRAATGVLHSSFEKFIYYSFFFSLGSFWSNWWKAREYYFVLFAYGYLQLVDFGGQSAFRKCVVWMSPKPTCVSQKGKRHSLSPRFALSFIRLVSCQLVISLFNHFPKLRIYILFFFWWRNPRCDCVYVVEYARVHRI